MIIIPYFEMMIHIFSMINLKTAVEKVARNSQEDFIVLNRPFTIVAGCVDCVCS